MKTVKFYKENNRWYADVEGHSKEDNEMVLGSDTFLELLSCGRNPFSIDFAYEPDEHLIPIDILTMTEHDEDGAFYTTEDNVDIIPSLYLCNVMHTVCGEHPEKIYIYFIRPYA